MNDTKSPPHSLPQLNNPSTSPPNPEDDFYTPAPPLAQSRYNRQLLIPSISLSGQHRISRSKVLIIGLGGLGSPASLYLAGAGVGTLGLLDHDVVELSNLHRQIVHRESSVHGAEGPTGKAQSAMRACRELNSEVEYVVHEVRIGSENAVEILRGYDVVLDCTDNPATRYLVSDVCVVLGKTLVSGAAQKLEGQIVVLNWPVYHKVDGERVVASRGPCYRCLFPHPPSPDLVKSCSEIGILGPVVGAIGTMMASEALRLIVRDGMEERKATMLLYNAWPTDPRSMFRVIGLRGRRKDCVACGDDEVLKEKGRVKLTEVEIAEGRMDYQTWCGRVEDVNLLREDERVDAGSFINQIIRSAQDKALIVDTREEFEVELGSKIKGSVNIPFSRILRCGNTRTSADRIEQPDELDTLLSDSKQQPIYFICQRGNDSQAAAKKLMDRMTLQVNGSEVDGISTRRWIGDVKGGFEALDRVSRPG